MTGEQKREALERLGISNASPLILLKLENIGDDSAPMMNFLGVNNSPWVAEITGFDKKYKYCREFLKGKKDYSQANSIGSRGVYSYFLLKENQIYEVYERVSWKTSERYFCTVKKGKIKKISESEVESWLKNQLEKQS